MKLKVSILCYGKKTNNLEKKKTIIKNSNKVDKANSTYPLIKSPLIY